MPNPTPVIVREKAILLTINQLYQDGMSGEELYEATRAAWVVGPRREKVDVAMAVYQGIVREVYRIRGWHPAGMHHYATRDAASFRGSRRWEFEGDVAGDLRGQYVGRFVGKGTQNPVRYVNA